MYLWRGHLSPSQEGGALLLNKIPTSNIVSLCQYSMVSRGRIWRWPGRRKLIHLPGIVGWLQQMDSLGYWPRIAWSRHAIRMFRDRNLGLISVLRNKIGSYIELNCCRCTWVVLFWISPREIYCCSALDPVHLHIKSVKRWWYELHLMIDSLNNPSTHQCTPLDAIQP